MSLRVVNPRWPARAAAALGLAGLAASARPGPDFDRYLEWARHRVWSPVVEVRHHPEKAGMGRFSFRWTRAGRRILSGGLRPLEAPQFPVGGAEAYGMDPTWALAGRGAEWRIERIVPAP